MREPDIEYAPTPDGAFLAYEVVGRGEVDLVLAAQMIPIASVWEDPVLAGAMERLAESVRLVLFDHRGLGASDPSPDSRVLTPEESMQDIVAVMDAAGSDRAFIFKTDSAAPAILLASSLPERVAGLVLLNAYARLARAQDYPIGLPDKLLALYIEKLQTHDRAAAFELLCRPRLEDAAFRQWFLKTYQRALTPGATLAMSQQDFATDARHVLPLVQVPTLVMHSAQNPHLRPTHGAYLADHIAGARHVELPGDGHNLAALDLDLVIDEVTEFVTGAPAARRTDRVFATVLFSDIVESTPRAIEVGDVTWKRMLDQHDRVVERQLARFDGQLVKTTGDGFVATFTGPARAVSCAIAVRDGLRRIGLEVRIGIHPGEVELRGDDVSGISVHIAARVQGRAAPGQVVVSRTVVDLVAGSGLEFEAWHEDVDLKGVPGQWRLYTVIT